MVFEGGSQNIYGSKSAPRYGAGSMHIWVLKLPVLCILEHLDASSWRVIVLGVSKPCAVAARSGLHTGRVYEVQLHLQHMETLLRRQTQRVPRLQYLAAQGCQLQLVQQQALHRRLHPAGRCVHLQHSCWVCLIVLCLLYGGDLHVQRPTSCDRHACPAHVKKQRAGTRS